MLKIIGANGTIKNIEKILKNSKEFAEKYNLIIQLFNADLIYGKSHLISAFEHAKRAMNRKTNSTNSLEMEILLYASGERQLKLAIPKMGVKNGKVSIACIFISDNEKHDKHTLESSIELFLKNMNLLRNDKVLEGDEDTLKKFGITNSEISTVKKEKYGDLILEKIAIVDIIK